MDSARLALLKTYCHMDDDAADTEVNLLQLFYQGAVGYMIGAGVKEPKAPEGGTVDDYRLSLYLLVVFALTDSCYERRDPTITGTIVADNPVLRQYIEQLKRTEPQSS